MQKLLATAGESGCSIGHDPLSLGGSDLTAQVRLAGLAKFTFFALRSTVGSQLDAEVIPNCQAMRGGNGVISY